MSKEVLIVKDYIGWPRGVFTSRLGLLRYVNSYQPKGLKIDMNRINDVIDMKDTPLVIRGCYYRVEKSILNEIEDL